MKAQLVRSTLIITFLGVFGACGDDVSPTDSGTSADTGLVTDSGIEADSGLVPDSGFDPDAAMPDGGPDADAGEPDAATPDTGDADTGISDAGVPDTALTDSGIEDSGPLPDGGSIDTTPPTAPTGLSGAAAAPTQINWSWTASTDDVGVVRYHVECCDGVACTDFAEVATPSSTTYAQMGLNPATSYTCRVRAEDAATNLSAFSNPSTAVTDVGVDNTPPSAPTGLRPVGVTVSSIDLAWDPATDNVAVALYRVEVCPSPCLATWYETGVSATTEFSDTGLGSNATYLYRVRAEDAAGNRGAYSTPISATTLVSEQTITLTPTNDNVVYTNSLDGSLANSVYQFDPLMVGCNWTYNLLTETQEFLCGQGLMRFNLSALAGRQIGSAILYLTTDSVGVGYYPRQWHLRALATAWSPSTVTWNSVANLQYYLASEIVRYPPGYFGQSLDIEVNVTTIVRNWVDGTWSNQGLAVGSHDYTWPYYTSWDAFTLYSREDPGGEGPRLVVVYW